MFKKIAMMILAAVTGAAVVSLALPATDVQAFSVDVKKLQYSDYKDPSTTRRVINYDFSGGSIANNVITIPSGANGVVQVPPIENPPLTYTFGPYPSPNDIAATLTSSAAKATLTTLTQGGMIINTTTTPTTPPVPQWDFAVALTNFTGMTDTTNIYAVQIGFGSPTPGPHPEFTAAWIPAEGGGRNLVLRAEIYDDTGGGSTVWGPVITAPITGFNPTNGVITLRVRNLVNGNQMVFDYSLDSGATWTTVGAVTFGFSNYQAPPDFPHQSFPAKFPYVALKAGTAAGGGSTISFTNSVSGAAGYPTAPIDGATVSLVGTPSISTATNTAGLFTLENIPVGAPFSVKVAKGGYVDVYSGLISSTQGNVTGRRPYLLLTTTEAGAAPWSSWTNRTETGMIVGSAINTANGFPLAGAVITAVNAANPATTYPVSYASGSSTGSDGRYYVFNVPAGVSVQLTAAPLSGYTWQYNWTQVKVYASGITQESFFATPSGGGTGITLTPPYALAAAGGGAGNFSVIVQSGVNWTAQSDNPGWLTITSGGSGTGSGTVNFTAAQNTGAARLGTITVNAGTAGIQTFVVAQGGTAISSPVVGAWGAAWLQYEIGPQIWYTEATRVVFNADGTGTMAGVKNDGINEPGSRIKQFGQSFTYTVANNADGSLNLTLNQGEGTFSARIVVSDNGNTAVMDGTDSPQWVALRSLVRIDHTKTYSAADLSGEYYFLGFERNVDNVADPTTGNGAYMTISGVQTFNGAGQYSYFGKANSVKIDGSNVIWDDTGKTNQPYAVTPAGGVTAESGAYQGALSGNGRVAGGTGSYLSNDWLGYYFLKKADKTYSTTDIAGKWAIVSIGQDSKQGEPVAFYSSIGTMTCSSAGACAIKVRNRESKAPTTPTISESSFTVTVAADGSFGASFGGPAYSGAIGNDGNTIIINPSFKTAEPWNREVVIGIRASGIGDLAVGTAPPTGNLLQNGDFAAGLNGWIVNPALGDWNPLTTGYDGMINLHPLQYGFTGAVIYQNLNLTGIAGKTFNVSMKLAKPYAPSDGKTIALYLTYLDSAGKLQRVRVLNPDNATITGATKSTATNVAGVWTAPAGAQKLVKLEIAKEYYGQFYLAAATLWADNVTTNPLPTITDTSAGSGDYGSSLTITGDNFGTTAGQVLIGGSAAGVTVTSWTNTSITVNIASPARGGNVVVVAGGVETNPDRTFQVTSPYFTVDLTNPSLRVIKGQKAEYILKTTFYNNFTTAGITFQLQGGNASTLTGITSFTPVPVKGSGGVAMRINTQTLGAGTYTADVVAINGAQSVPVGTLNLQVVTVKEINVSDFYVTVWDQSKGESVKSPFTGGTITKQGQVYIDARIIGSDDQPVNDGEALTVASNNPSVMGVFKRAFGYEFYAVMNGAATITATAPDGFQKTVNVTVNVTGDRVTSIGVAPSPISNTRTDDIAFSAEGTIPLGWIGYDSSGMMNFQTDFLDKLVRSGNGATSSFKLTKTPSDMGTVMLYASTGTNSAYAPLTIVNDPASGQLNCFIRTFDGSSTHGMATFHFFDESGLFKFTRSVYLYFSAGPIPVGNIPPGSYKILYLPGGMMNLQPQWYPNAATFAEAQTLSFTAGQKTSDIYFFNVPQPAGASVTLPVTGQTLTTPAQATGQFTVNATPVTVWAAVSNDAWIKVTSGISGVGSGTVGYAVEANTAAAQRSGTISINDKTFIITQPGTDGPFKGDINGDKQVNLADAILALKVLAGMNTEGVRADYAASGADVNGDNRVGLHEALYILQYVAGLRN